MIYPSITLLIVVLSVQFVQSDTCGRRSTLVESLINRGNQSHLGEWPWHVAVYHRIDKSFPTYACGGTIIARRYILTAAHCTYPETKTRPLTINEIEVVVGITDRKEKEPSLRQMSVAKIERHEDYNLSTTGYDIALLKLTNELDFTDYVKPICLWMGSDGDEEIKGKDGYVPGWGRDENSELPDKLKHVKMLIVSRKDCQASDDDYYSRYLFDRMGFCAGNRDGSSVNSGDSGGGLYIEIDGEWKLRGIVSHGKFNPTIQQVDTSSFIVFADVAHFRPWIQSRMGVRSPSDQDTEDYAVCGKKKELKIQRIRFKEERKWPWQGEVYRNKVRLCDVVIVSEFFLLSPADVYSENDVRNPVNLKVIFKNGTDHVFANYLIERVLRHENFTRRTRMNNIALLYLGEKIKFSSLLRPICVESSTDLYQGYTGNHIVRGYLGCSYHESDFCTVLTNHKRGERTFCFRQEEFIPQSDHFYIKRNGTYYLRGLIYNVLPFRNKYKIEVQSVHLFKDWIQNQQHQDHRLGRKPRNLLAQNCTQDEDAYKEYQVALLGDYQCYCTLIAPTLMITSGSCVDGLTTELIRIRTYQEERVVREIHFHPHFDIQRFINNIAIIEINAPFENRLPICLPTSDQEISKFPTQMALSRYTDQMPWYDFGDPLNLTITNVKTCAHTWQRQGFQLATDGSYICANLEADSIRQLKNISKCKNGLEGKPLFFKMNDTYFTRGILSIDLENHCDQNGLPEVFVDVMFYTDWIHATYLKCSSCHKTSVADDEDEEPIEEWRNVDPRKRFPRNQATDSHSAFGEELRNYGNQSYLAEWPWYSAVFHRFQNISRYVCGGTILSRSYIVTAAHCTWTKSKSRPLTISEMEVVVGITRPVQQLAIYPSMLKQQILVARIDRHEDYNSSTSENDIALLQLVGELEFTDYVQPICIWSQGDGEEAVVGKLGYVPGWRQEEHSGFSEILYHVQMPIVSRMDCRESDVQYYNISSLNDGRAFCAGYRNGSLVKLSYDGSGLYIKFDRKWILRGIVSSAIIYPTTGQSDTSSFMVFTDVLYFRPWIYSKMGPVRLRTADDVERFYDKISPLQYAGLG